MEVVLATIAKRWTRKYRIPWKYCTIDKESIQESETREDDVPMRHGSTFSSKFSCYDETMKYLKFLLLLLELSALN